MKGQQQERQRQQLYEFVRTHYFMAYEGGHVEFHCSCRNPDNCSVWRHHPDLDAAIVDLLENKAVLALSNEDVNAMNRMLYGTIWCAANGMIVIFCAVEYRPTSTTKEEIVLVALGVFVLNLMGWNGRKTLMKILNESYKEN